MREVCASQHKNSQIPAGMVGVTCACLGADVTLTDVPSVLPMARANIELNARLIETAGGRASTAALDWSADPNQQGLLDEQYDVVLGGERARDVPFITTSCLSLV